MWSHCRAGSLPIICHLLNIRHEELLSMTKLFNRPQLVKPLCTSPPASIVNIMPLVHDFRGSCPELVNGTRNKVKNFTSLWLTSTFWFFQRRLGDAAKKAISKLQVRTIKKGDKVTTSFRFGKELFKKLLTFLTARVEKESIGKGKRANSAPVSVLLYPSLSNIV